MRTCRVCLMMVFLCTLLGCSAKQSPVVTDADLSVADVVVIDSVLPVATQDSVLLEENEIFTGEPSEGGEYVEDDYFSDEDEPMQEINDPLMGWNRFWFGANHYLYLGVIDPIYTGYAAVTPESLRNGLGNVSHNLAMPVRVVNACLQGELGGAVIEIGKFLVNTIVGFGGLADVTKEKALLVPYTSRNSHFGMTLASWGVGEGPYLVLPLFGPSGVRAGIGLGGDVLASPFTWAVPLGDISRLASYGIGYTLALNDFSNLLEGYKMMTKSAVEPYIAVRAAYLTSIRARVQAMKNK